MKFKDGNVEKLICTLFPKDFYVTHSLYLQFAMSVGYSLEKIYAATSFRQQKYLKTYLNILQEKRTKNHNIPYFSTLMKLLANVSFNLFLMTILH